MVSTRNTIQRQIVLDAVFSLKNHPTAEEVYSFIKPNYPSISLGTVYRNLNLLSESGKLLKVSITDAADRFDHNVFTHYHIKCSKCENISDIDIDYMHEMDKKVAEVTGFGIESHDIIFKGVCPNCL